MHDAALESVEGVDLNPIYSRYSKEFELMRKCSNFDQSKSAELQGGINLPPFPTYSQVR